MLITSRGNVFQTHMSRVSLEQKEYIYIYIYIYIYVYMYKMHLLELLFMVHGIIGLRNVVIE